MKNLSTILLIGVLVSITGCSRTKKDSSNTQKATGGAVTLQLFQEDGVFGYREVDGPVAIKPKFTEAGEFSEGLARVKVDPADPWGYINTSGETMITPQYEGASDFVNGKAVVLTNEKFMEITPEGIPVGVFEYDQPYKPPSAGEHLFVVHPSGLIARALGESSSDAVGNVQFGEEVEYVYDPHPKQSETIEGFRGNWLSVRYQNKRGYLFDVFLSRLPQTEEKRVVESYHVIVSGLEGDGYSVYDLSKFSSGGRLKTHEGSTWAESEEIVPNATVDQVIAKERLFPSGDRGTIVQRFTGESRTFTTDNGESFSITVRRDAQGFLESVVFSRKTDEVTTDLNIERHNLHDVAISIASSQLQDPTSN